MYFLLIFQHISYKVRCIAEILYQMIYFEEKIHSTVASKINVTPKIIYLPVSKLHS